MAQKLGYFADAGLDVSIQTPSDPAAPIKQVAAGQTDLAISYEPEVLLAHEQGLDVIAVGALVDRPLTSMIWLEKSGIRGRRRPARQDDRHRRHPLPGRLPEDDPRPRQADPLRREDGQRRLRPAAGARRRPAPRRCWAASATSRASTCACAAKTRSSPRSTSSACPPTTSSSSSPTASRLEEDPEPIRLFLAALARGTAAAVESPDATTEALLEANPDLDPKLTRGRGRRRPCRCSPARRHG